MRKELLAAVLTVAWLALAPAAMGASAGRPRLARTVVVSRISGVVRVKAVGAHRFSVLTRRLVLPVGSTVDAGRGKVRLVTADVGRGRTQSGSFGGGAFVVTQDRSGLTTLTLARGPAATRACAAGSRPAASSAAKTPKVLRLLHGSAHGKFRTVGRYAAATVRGTRWTTAESCSETMISDNRGQVATQSNNAELSYALNPGARSIYRCAADGQPPVSSAYCLAALTEDRTAIVNGHPVRSFDFATGVATESTADTAQLCIAGPQRRFCTDYPLTPTDRFGFRIGLAACVPYQGPGGYSLTWMVAGVALGAPLAFRAPVGAEFQPCLTELGEPETGAQSVGLEADVKQVTRYVIPTVGHARDINVYLRPTGLSGQQLLQGVIYADAGGIPGSLLGTTGAITFPSTASPGWYTLTLPRQRTTDNPSGLLLLQPGAYWIGIIAGGDPGVAAVAYDPVPADLTYNTNPFTSGPSDPFGPAVTLDERISLYLTYYAPPF
ncbi:MAG TPA: hypothetical protein VLC49_01750 [Solirubrobacteraceae bacterium]|nr:hypothetical protein [Solirubrobacteraceae bacterium]